MRVCADFSDFEIENFLLFLLGLHCLRSSHLAVIFSFVTFFIIFRRSSGSPSAAFLVARFLYTSRFFIADGFVVLHSKKRDCGRISAATIAAMDAHWPRGGRHRITYALQIADVFHF